MTEPTSPLRQRMIDDMTIRNMTPGTQKVYVRAVKNFSLFFERSPDKLTFDDVREYHLHLASRKLEAQTINQIMCALRFFYGTTLGKPDVAEHIPLARRSDPLLACTRFEWHAVKLLTAESSMLSRRLLILGCGWTLVEYPWLGHSQEAWTTYRNPRFGTSIAYQEFFEPDAPPANGDGQSFTGPEGANFRVYARYNIENETPASYLAKLLADPSRPDVTYKHIENDRVTISGIRGVLIYYHVYIFSGRGVVHAFEIEYPAKFKDDYDPTIERMARSFTGP